MRVQTFFPQRMRAAKQGFLGQITDAQITRFLDRTGGRLFDRQAEYGVKWFFQPHSVLRWQSARHEEC